MKLAEKIAFFTEDDLSTMNQPQVAPSGVPVGGGPMIPNNIHLSIMNNFLNKRDSISLLEHNGLNAPDVLLAIRNGATVHDVANHALSEHAMYKNFDGSPATKQDIINQL